MTTKTTNAAAANAAAHEVTTNAAIAAPLSHPLSQPLDAWEMTCAILTATRETLKVARGELEAAMKAGGQNPFAPGVSKASQIIGILQQTERDMGADMYRLAKSNGLALPEKLTG